ncbi:MAG: KTSC domain-containing protein [Nitrososphaera sp.]
MYRQRIRSGKLKSVGYDFGRKILEVELHRGDIYQFFEVPQSMYYTLMAAESKNTYFDFFIYRKFPMRRL